MWVTVWVGKLVEVRLCVRVGGTVEVGNRVGLGMGGAASLGAAGGAVQAVRLPKPASSANRTNSRREIKSASAGVLNPAEGLGEAVIIYLRVTSARTVPARSCRAISFTLLPALAFTTHSTLTRSSVESAIQTVTADSL